MTYYLINLKSEENKQKRILVENKMEIVKKSIEYYQRNKKEIIDKIMEDQINNEKKDLEVKENELMFWKHEYEKKLLNDNDN